MCRVMQAIIEFKLEISQRNIFSALCKTQIDRSSLVSIAVRTSEVLHSPWKALESA